MSFFIFWTTVGILLGTVYSSFFEWALHRFLMHHPVGIFTYPFERHALVHHRIFKADHTYHLIDERDKPTIPMAWWNGPLLIAVTQIPFLLAALFSEKWGILCGSTLACSAYYGAYEYLHWCMHLPRQRNVERSGIFFRLNGHHLLHHRYMNRNFNVVFPLADLCLGTLLRRSKVHFKQAQGPSVPNVQPRISLKSVPQCR
ncbi:MAG: sterol desaturase family protein [Verrucomicrobia bacterium]|nr:sterol desaturase family protein [Verrucomicrobiota bacterium]